MPTRPGHCPDQLVTVQSVPCGSLPGQHMMRVFAQTASATISGMRASIPPKTSIPSRCDDRKAVPDGLIGCCRSRE